VTADVKNNALIINGTTVHVITANAPEEIDYTSYGIDHALSIIQVLLRLRKLE
jgi:glyceraldehyde 3-phosphate dehydrogenase